MKREIKGEPTGIEELVLSSDENEDVKVNPAACKGAETPSTHESKPISTDSYIPIRNFEFGAGSNYNLTFTYI